MAERAKEFEQQMAERAKNFVESLIESDSGVTSASMSGSMGQHSLKPVAE
jgi:tRNA U54 and U55 pseudouridine synthase Pus10